MTDLRTPSKIKAAVAELNGIAGDNPSVASILRLAVYELDQGNIAAARYQCHRAFRVASQLHYYSARKCHV